MPTPTTTFRHRAYHWLALVPPIGMLGGVPLANRVHALVWGLPFLLLWIVVWVFLTAGCMTLLYALDHRATADERGEA